DDSESMFEAVCVQLLEDTKEPGLKDKIHEIDKQVNNLQKEIRRRIVEHLSLQPTIDISACLILMSVVKDAERLGDYSKNLYEVTELLAQPIDRELFSEYFDELDKKILALFQQTKEAFIDTNEDQARSAWEYEKTIAKGCDKIVERLAQSNLPVNHAVCFTLLARHFKRIVAHLVNIATSVILPLSDLDYFDERTREG
ncbi:MAG: PhoU domain-containing protein, partial [Planctomycetota bacterium]